MDVLSKADRSQLMSSVKSQNTQPELRVRRVLFHLGFRYRLHVTDLPGRPDIVLRKHRTVIFVHGCFWHGCTKCDRGTRIPKTNTEDWIKKITTNKARDTRVKEDLETTGWRVITIWDCETRAKEYLQSLLLKQLTPRIIVKSKPKKSGL